MPLPLFRFAVICLRCCRGGYQIRPLFFGRVSFHAKGFALRGEFLFPRRKRNQNAAGGGLRWASPPIVAHPPSPIYGGYPYTLM